MAWYNASWLYRAPVVSQNAKVDEALGDAYIDLADMPAGFWSHITGDNDSDTKLLLNCDGPDGAVATRDRSLTPHSIAFAGNADLDTAQKKFGASSLRVQGTDDYVWAADHPDWDPGTGAYTVDFWIRFPSFASGSAQAFVSAGGLGHTLDTAGWTCGYIPGAPGYLSFYSVAAGTENNGCSFTPNNDQWYHLAYVRESDGTVHLFIDGVDQAIVVGDGTDSNNITTSQQLRLGINWQGGQDVNAYIDDVRISKGVARWTSGFTPPAAAYRYFGGEIRATQADGSTEVAREIVSCNPLTQEGEVHLDTTGMLTGADVTWYLYYGNAAASDYAKDATYGAENVWGSEYVGVWHLSGDELDSTDHDNAGVNTGTTDAAGQVGRARDFESTESDVITVPDSADWDFGSGSFVQSFWVKLETLQAPSYFISQFPGAGAFQSFAHTDSGTDRFEWYSHDGGSFRLGFSAAFTIATATWYKVDIVRDVNTWYVYVDGVDLANNVLALGSYSNAMVNVAAPLLFGNQTSGLFIDGMLDEIRIVKGAARSANYLATQFNNQDDPATFWSIGAEETDTAIIYLDRDASAILQRDANAVLERVVL